MTRPKPLIAVILLLATLGIADSIYLTVLKTQQEVKGYADSQVCRALSAQGCDIALDSGPSSIGPVPISLVAVATYVVVLGLGIMWLLGQGGAFGGAAIALISLGAVFWSAGLAWFSYSRGSWCPFCIGLYGVNIGLLVASSWALRRGPIAVLTAGLKDVLASPKLIGLALVATLALVGIGYASMQAAINAGSGERQKRDIQRLEAAISGGQFVVSVDGIPMIGPADAPLTVIKMSDFECPYCGKFWLQVEEFRKRYPDLIRVGFINHPLAPECNPMMNGAFHANACRAAYAAWCAHQQGRFWEMGDELFTHQHALAADDIAQYATDIGLNAAAFNTCMEADETRRAVERQALFARSVGAAGTPASLINGLLFGGALDVRSLKSLSRTLPSRMAKGKPSPGRLKVIQDQALEAGRQAVEPSPRGLVAPSEKRLELVVFADPSNEADRSLIEAVTTLANGQPHQIRLSFRAAAPAACKSDPDTDECLGARMLVCSMAASQPKIPLVLLARHAGPIAEVESQIREMSAPFGACLDTGTLNDQPIGAAIAEDIGAWEAIKDTTNATVFVDKYPIEGRPDWDTLDAFIARIQLDRRR